VPVNFLFVSWPARVAIAPWQKTIRYGKLVLN